MREKQAHSKPPTTCYAVIENDRGAGITIEGVYLDKNEAEKHAEASSHLYIEETNFYEL